MQLQKTGDWDARVDAAFAKLDSNGDGYIDLEELLAQLPFEAEESYDGERLIEVHRNTTAALALSPFQQSHSCRMFVNKWRLVSVCVYLPCWHYHQGISTAMAVVTPGLWQVLDSL